jgi:hypothetical protein
MSISSSNSRNDYAGNGAVDTYNYTSYSENRHKLDAYTDTDPAHSEKMIYYVDGLTLR